MKSITALYNLFLKHPQISTDSRKIEKDSLFFALKGENFNGNTYASTALANGAAYSVIDEVTEPMDDRYILVENVLAALQEFNECFNTDRHCRDGCESSR